MWGLEELGIGVGEAWGMLEIDVRFAHTRNSWERCTYFSGLGMAVPTVF
jgi:hypothetical protein